MLDGDASCGRLGLQDVLSETECFEYATSVLGISDTFSLVVNIGIYGCVHNGDVAVFSLAGEPDYEDPGWKSICAGTTTSTTSTATTSTSTRTTSTSTTSTTGTGTATSTSGTTTPTSGTA